MERLNYIRWDFNGVSYFILIGWIIGLEKDVNEWYETDENWCDNWQDTAISIFEVRFWTKAWIVKTFILDINNNVDVQNVEYFTKAFMTLNTSRSTIVIHYITYTDYIIFRSNSKLVRVY